jgi:hypothetical protein
MSAFGGKADVVLSPSCVAAFCKARIESVDSLFGLGYAAMVLGAVGLTGGALLRSGAGWKPRRFELFVGL